VISIKKFLIIFTCIFFIIQPYLILGDSKTDIGEIKKLYLHGNFKEISDKYKDINLKKIDNDVLQIYLEALIRNSEGVEASELLNTIKKKYGETVNTLLLEGMYALSKGDLVKVSTITNSLSKNDTGMIGVLQLLFFDELYRRNFNRAEIWLNKMEEHESGFGRSDLFFLLSSGFYNSVKNFKELSKLFKKRMKEIKKSRGKNYYKSLKLNYKLYKRRINGTYFGVDSIEDKIVIPFEIGKKDFLKSIILKIGNDKFKILIDTGNTSGWILHSRKLREKLKYYRGGRTVMQVGTESENLDGFNIFCKSVNFGNFKISELFGSYIPKPHKNFFDANLNPVAISNRVVSFDFINNSLVLRTYERFFKEIEETSEMEVMKIPWYGYMYPMVPVLCNSKNGLAVIETGAKNISVEKNFATNLGISISKRSKYLSNGKIFNYSLGAINVQLGKYLFVRRNAEIWPLKQFKNRLSGFSPHLIIGPEALEGKFVVSFVPKNNIIVFEYEKKK